MTHDAPASAHALEKALADDERTHELGLHVTWEDDALVVSGEVATHERRDAVHQVLRDRGPDLPLVDRVHLSAEHVERPAETETITASKESP